MTACLRLKLIHYVCSFCTVIKMSPICWWITNASFKWQPQECVLITSARESKDTHAEEANRYYDMLEIVLVAWNVTLLSCRKWVRQDKTAENEIEKSDVCPNGSDVQNERGSDQRWLGTRSAVCCQPGKLTCEFTTKPWPHPPLQAQSR